MAIFTVIAANDPGTQPDGRTGSIGTLSWALAQANATSGPDTIEITVDVTLSGPLSPIFNSVVINGNGHTIDAGGTTRILIVGVELDSSAGFDTTEYLAAYPDLAAANVKPLLHYLQFGVHEFGVQ